MLEKNYNCDLDIQVSVFVPKGICVNVSQNPGGVCSLAIESSLISSVIGRQSFFTSVSKDVFYLSETEVSEGLGGTIYICAPKSCYKLVQEEARRLSKHFSTIFQLSIVSLELVGSGFRARCFPDKVYQNGACLHLQLGSKNFVVRLP